jgi:HEAT repeat protein
MTEALLLSAVALTGATVLSIVVLAVRRVVLARDERLRRELEPKLRPAAFALMDGEEPDFSALDERGAQVLAGMLNRYAHVLSGESRAYVCAYFERNGHVTREIKRTHDRRAWRRAAAAHSLAEMGSVAAQPALLRLLGDDEIDVREAAARGLGMLLSVEAVEPLIRALVSGAVPRAIAAQALLTIGASAVPQLRELAASDNDAIRGRAVELIGLVGDASDADIPLEHMRDPAAEVRARSAMSLGRLGAREAGLELRLGLEDRIPFVRTNAATALGWVGDHRAVDELVHRAREDTFDPARAAAQALARIDPARLSAEAEREDSGPHLAEAADALAVRG